MLTKLLSYITGVTILLALFVALFPVFVLLIVGYTLLWLAGRPVLVYQHGRVVGEYIRWKFYPR